MHSGQSDRGKPVEGDAGPSANSADNQQRVEQFLRTGDIEVINALAKALHRNVAATPFGHPARAQRLSDLGNLLLRKFMRTSLTADLEEAISVGMKAVEAIPIGHFNRPGLLSNLSVLLLARYERTGSLQDLEEAVSADRKSVEATPPGHPERARCLSNLSNSLQSRYTHTANTTDLDDAIRAGRESVKATRSDDPRRSGFLSNLSSALGSLYDRTGALANLQEAILVNLEALRASQPDDLDRPRLLSGHGIQLRERFLRTGAQADLEESIHALREAVDGTPTGHPNRPMFLSNLGNALWTRYERTGDATDLDEAIDIGREAVESTPDSHPNRPMFLSAFGGKLWTRYRRTGEPTNLHEAVDANRKAVDAVPAEHVGRAGYLSNLGVTLHARYQHTGDTTDLDEAIRVAREAVEATPIGHPDRASRLTNLVNTLRDRYVRAKSLQDLEDAINVGRAAVQATSVVHLEHSAVLFNLGLALQDRYQFAGAQPDLDEALACFHAAATSVAATPSMQVSALRQLGDLTMLKRSSAAEAASLFRRAVEVLATQVAPRHLDWGDQEQLLSRHAGLIGDAVAAHLQVDNVIGALQVAELGRGILLTRAIDDRSDLKGVRAAFPKLADAFEQALSELNAPPPEPMATSENRTPSAMAQRRDWVQRRERAADQHSEILTQIRQHPGFEDFLQAPSIENLSTNETADGAAVLVNASKFRCDAIILRAGREPVPVNLADLTASHVRQRVIDLLRAVHDPRPAAGQLHRARVVPDVLEWLWVTITGPVLHALGVPQPASSIDTAPRVWWVPTGLLTALPLHAAGPRNGPATLDYVISSYSPTIRARTVPRRSTLPTKPSRMVAAMPTTPALSNRPGALPLPGAAEEADSLTHITTPLTGANATVAAVSRALAATTWAHLACHAEANPMSPSRSRLLLHDGDIDVPTIARLKLDAAELAYLSACSTATAGIRHADEVISVATAFRIAGYRHVVGTLWPLSDKLAPFAAT